MKTKKYLFVFCACILTQGCLNKSNIDLLKSSIMNDNKSLTIGEAFDGWNKCKSRNWDELKTDNGREVIQFLCKSDQHSIFKLEMISVFKELNITEDDHRVKDALDKLYKKDNSDVEYTYQWVVNKDGSFDLSYTGFSFEFPEVGHREIPYNKREMVSMVYDNKIFLGKFIEKAYN